MKRAALIFVALVLSGEIVARFVIGLGDPPLSVADPDVEYMFKPGSYARFHHGVTYNAWSMRSRAVTQRKEDPEELRILVAGDSIINGGSLMDDSELATARLESRLTAAHPSRKVFVGNVSAGSWGPPNVDAYLAKFGTFDADAIVLVLNPEDVTDVPTFAPVLGTTSMPDRRPMLAVGEAITRYLLPRLGLVPAIGPAPAPTGAAAAQSPEARVLEAVERIFARFANKRRILVLSYMRMDAQASTEPTPLAAIEAKATELGVEVLSLWEQQRQRPSEIFSDELHLTVAGQELLGQSLFETLGRPQRAGRFP